VVKDHIKRRNIKKKEAIRRSSIFQALESYKKTSNINGALNLDLENESDKTLNSFIIPNGNAFKPTPMKALHDPIVDIVEFIDKFKKMKKPCRKRTEMNIMDILFSSPKTASTRDSAKISSPTNPKEQKLLFMKKAEDKQALPLKTIRKLLASQMMTYELSHRARRNSSVCYSVKYDIHFLR
jgi:hypothetical protein